MPIEQKKNNLILRLLSKYISYLAVILGVVLCVLGFIFILRPKFQSNKAKPELTLSYQQEQLETRKAKLNQLNDLITDYKKLPASHFSKVNELLPDQNDGPLIFTHLSAIAKAHDSVLLNASVSEVGGRDLVDLLIAENSAKPANIQIVQVNASFLGKSGVGSYEYYKELLDAIQRSVKLFDIENISFSPDSANFNMNARTYYLQK
jgi:uncharacterized membrane-anchored protein YhcB (DUF1043 family)